MFRTEIVTEVCIEAPPARVWSVLTDLPRYAEWNPFIREAAGALAPGGRLQLGMAPDGGAKLFRISPVLLTVIAEVELRWAGRILLPGLFDAEHRFLLRPEGAATQVEHAERFSGLLIPLFGDLLRNTQTAFERMNAALKARCEAPAA